MNSIKNKTHFKKLPRTFGYFIFALLVQCNGSVTDSQSMSWSIQNSDVSVQLQGVWGASESDVFAVGDAGTILHYDGVNWIKMSTGSTAHLNAVWGRSGSDVFAVGNAGTILHYNGSSWNRMTSNTTSSLLGVWGDNLSTAYAVGAGGTIMKQDGNRWVAMQSGTSATLRGIWGDVRRAHPALPELIVDIFAVGDRGAKLHFDGTNWAQVGSSGNSIFAIWGNGWNDMLAVALFGKVFKFTGTLFVSQPNIPTTQQLFGVSGDAEGNVFIVGSNGLILQSDRSGWNLVASPTFKNLNDVWVAESGIAFAVGFDGTVIRFGQ